jgi:pyruvate,orthophosphate dikinase
VTTNGTKWVYSFGRGVAEGQADMRNLLGGKGAGLAEMSNLGLPVPPGFTITTEVCTHFYAHDKSYPPDRRQVRRPGEAAAGLGAFGRARLDAGDDGYRPQSRPQR